MHKNPVFRVLALAIVAIATSKVQAEDIAWDKVIGCDTSKLTKTQKTRVESELKRLANTRGCKGTVAQCLASGDLTARRHAGFVARMVRKGKDSEFIKKGIQDRAESAFPGEVFEINLTDHPHSGKPEAKVRVVEYACFQCPFCAHLAPQLKKLKKEFGDDVVYFYKFFPVRSHPRGVATAIAGVAAYRQNSFWSMHDLMYENRTKLGDDDLVGYAKAAGLNVDKFKMDIKDPGAMSVVEKDKLEGMRFGVEGTPTFFVNGKQFIGVQDFDELKDRIAEELDIIAGRIR